MKWLQRKPNAPSPEVLAAKIQADIVHKAAQEGHQEALSLTQKLHQIRERNHFGESLEGLYREKRT